MSCGQYCILPTQQGRVRREHRHEPFLFWIFLACLQSILVSERPQTFSLPWVVLCFISNWQLLAIYYHPCSSRRWYLLSIFNNISSWLTQILLLLEVHDKSHLLKIDFLFDTFFAWKCQERTLELMGMWEPSLCDKSKPFNFSIPTGKHASFLKLDAPQLQWKCKVIHTPNVLYWLLDVLRFFAKLN